MSLPTNGLLKRLIYCEPFFEIESRTAQASLSHHRKSSNKDEEGEGTFENPILQGYRGDIVKNFKYIWIIGLGVTLAILIVPIAIFVRGETASEDDPWENVPIRQPHTDHTVLFEGPFETGSDVTLACLECHEDAAFEIMETVHWTWESEPYDIEGRDGPVTVGKKNSLNNFCIGIQSNWPGCTSCHAGYGWVDADYDFTISENVDCLVCHDGTGTYVKDYGGYPVEGVDLLASAQSVGVPTRDNCGYCHFTGGGGNAVKHGDLDEHLYNPSENVDVHMGGQGFLCIDCHQTEDHEIRGRSMSVSLDQENQALCTDCHIENLHDDERINSHTDAVACQTCHIPAGAVRDATKMSWDWSTAGQDIGDDPHSYLKIKGSFVYEYDFIPEYYWLSGIKDRYLLGDVIDPDETTILNPPDGDISDPEALIFPFKVHRAKQPYDVVNNYLLQPKTVGEGGYWTEFDWDKSLQLGSEVAGLDFSGEYDFAETEMYWPLSHLVAPTQFALQCMDCHGEGGRMDWDALGYNGDPIVWGGRVVPTH
jgi:octaheme c-type cytochrome (tetrathionate reductase family)